jgi:hypothetical protein
VGFIPDFSMGTSEVGCPALIGGVPARGTAIGVPMVGVRFTFLKETMVRLMLLSFGILVVVRRARLLLLVDLVVLVRIVVLENFPDSGELGMSNVAKVAEEVGCSGFLVLSEDNLDDSFDSCLDVDYYCCFCFIRNIIKVAMLHKGKSVL